MQMYALALSTSSIVVSRTTVSLMYAHCLWRFAGFCAPSVLSLDCCTLNFGDAGDVEGEPSLPTVSGFGTFEDGLEGGRAV